MIVFLVSGLWHGAAWTFVVWGFLHGAYQVVGDILRRPKNALWARLGVRTEAFSWILGKVMVTFMLVNIAWIFFRATSLQQGLDICWSMLASWDPWTLFDGSIFRLGLSEMEMGILVASIVVLALIDGVRFVKGQNIADFLMEQNLWFRWVVCIGLIVAVYVFGIYGPSFTPSQFIYFQF